MRLYLKCDHPACGRIRELSIADEAVVAGHEAIRWRNHPCPYCLRRTHNKQVGAEEALALAKSRAIAAGLGDA